jgi:hypothetical protein
VMLPLLSLMIVKTVMASTSIVWEAVILHVCLYECVCVHLRVFIYASACRICVRITAFAGAHPCALAEHRSSRTSHCRYSNSMRSICSLCKVCLLTQCNHHRRH